MPDQQFSVQRASRSELADLTKWYELVESATLAGPSAVYNGRRVEAFDDGVLGAALELDDDEDIRRAFDRVASLGEPETAMIRRLLARTLVLSVRMDSQTVGALEMGPPAGPYKQLLTQLEQNRASESSIIAVHMNMTVRVTKLHMVAVLPKVRGRGLGSALVDQAIDTARRSACKQMNGQFDSRTTQLASFYSELGFTIRPKGSSIRLVGGHQVQATPSEHLGYQMLRRP